MMEMLAGRKKSYHPDGGKAVFVRQPERALKPCPRDLTLTLPESVCCSWP